VVFLLQFFSLAVRLKQKEGKIKGNGKSSSTTLSSLEKKVVVGGGT